MGSSRAAHLRLVFALLLAGVPQEGPPGLRLVAGGETKVGSTVADVERWIREGDRTFMEFLAGETPQLTAEVDDFWLMVTEVTQEQYAAYVEQLTARGVGGPQLQEYRVRRGDSLWKIARSHGTTVDEIREVNGLRDSQIFVGQVIDVPLGS